MSRKIIAVLALAFAVGIILGGVTYMGSNELIFGEYLRKLTGTSDTLVASGEADETSDALDVSGETQASGSEGEGSEGAGGGLEGAVSGDEADAGSEGSVMEGGAGPEDGASGEATGAQAGEAPGVRNAGGDSEDGENTAILEADSSEYLIEDFEIIYQMPELPTGCEIVAMTMVLHYYGFDVDKTVMASEYLPTAAASFYYGSDGLKYGPDLNKYFVGDPFSNAGYICGTEAILTAANSYLQDEGSSLVAVDMTGATPEELYRLISQDVPVMVWVTIGMVARYSTAGWYTEEGEYVEWSSNDHGAVLIGYTEDTVTIADPISGLVEYSREDFESVFESRGNQCVVLRG